MSPWQGSSKNAAAAERAGGERDAPSSVSSCYTTPSSSRPERPHHRHSYNNNNNNNNSQATYPYSTYYPPYGYDPQYAVRQPPPQLLGTATAGLVSHLAQGATVLRKRDANGSFITPDASRDIPLSEIMTPASASTGPEHDQHPLSHARHNPPPGTFDPAAAPLSSVTK